VIRTAALWLICAAAALAAFAAVVGTAESMNLQNITLAQAYTRLYLLKQPAAAVIFIVVSALAVHEAFVAGTRGAAALALVPSLLAAELFLAGPEGPLLPGAAWILLKAALVLSLIMALRRVLRALVPARVFAIACAAVLAGLINAAATALGAVS